MTSSFSRSADMKLIRIIPALLALAIALPLAAAVNWEKNGLSLVSSNAADKERDKNTARLKDKAGHEIVVSWTGADLADDQVARVTALTEQFYAFKLITVDQLTFTRRDGGLIEVTVLPAAFKSKDQDFMPNLPAGLTFMFANKLLDFDFRMVIDNVFVRMKGTFTNEEKLAERMGLALKDPLAYIRRNSLDFALEQIEKLQLRTEELESKLVQAQTDSQQAQAEAQRELGKLRTALMLFQNRGFFGDIQAIKPEVLAAIIGAKQSQPTWTRLQIGEQLRRNKIEVNDNEILVVFVTFFNEYK